MPTEELQPASCMEGLWPEEGQLWGRADSSTENREKGSFCKRLGLLVPLLTPPVPS